MNEIKIFNNPQFGDIRTAGTSEQPLFCLADVCRVLELTNTNNVKKSVGDPYLCSIEVGVQTGVKADGTPATQNHQMMFLTEPGLYKCIFQSRKKEAEVFQDWVTSEVLPSIRKNGGYMVARDEETAEEVMARALLIADKAMKEKDRRIRTLEAENDWKEMTITEQESELKQAAPKVLFFDSAMQSDSTFTSMQIGTAIGMTANKLNDKLCEIGVCFKQSGTIHPYSRYKNCGIHKMREHHYQRHDGSTGVRMYTVWTQKGYFFIHTLMENNWDVRKAERIIRELKRQQEAV